MCGISGFITNTSISETQLHSLVTAMSDAIAHRGPDGDGIWLNANEGVAIAHRRLAIIDLTTTGEQPMTSSCGNLVMVYNGEVYNARELSQELTNLNLRGTSDSEIILEAFSQWGITKTAKKLIGMFAISIWNRSERTLTLVRDRLGIKPIYWSNTGHTFLFGSELKALTQHPDCPKKINHNAIAGYLRKCYINAPHSIFEGVHKLLPGSILTVTAGSEPKIEQFWSLDNVISNSTPYVGSDHQALTDLEVLLQDAVSRRMISDVPLGAFLSGGIDSSLVASLMQNVSKSKIKTFSIGFDIEEYNEAQHAAKVAQHLGTEHTELYVTASDALNIIPSLTSMYDEPFADASQIPTFLVSKLTRKHVTVALSGDGGDELFTGYERYFTSYKYRNILKQPQALMNAEAIALEALTPELVRKLNNFIPGFKNLSKGNRLSRLAPILREGDLIALYRKTLSHNENPNNLLLRGTEEHGIPWQRAKNIAFNDEYAMMQYIDTLDYLPDDILTKLDRASMAVSLEARVPLIDHRVVEFAWSLPKNMRVRDGQGKWLLRQLLYKYVPRELVDRPKMGFGVPIDHWLRKPLRDWAEDLLSTESLRDTGIFNPVPVKKMWQEHLNNDYNWQYGLWDILCMQDWARKNTYEN